MAMCKCSASVPCLFEVFSFISSHKFELACKHCFIKFYYRLVRISKSRKLVTEVNFVRIFDIFCWFSRFFQCFLIEKFKNYRAFKERAQIHLLFRVVKLFVQNDISYNSSGGRKVRCLFSEQLGSFRMCIGKKPSHVERQEIKEMDIEDGREI